MLKKFLKKIRILGVVAALVVGGSTAAFADPTQINISGSTLFADFFSYPSSTNDFIDVDGNGFFGYHENGPPYVQPLCNSYGSSNFAGSWWYVTTRGVGSGTGLVEMTTFQVNGTMPALPAMGSPGNINDICYINNIAYSNSSGTIYFVPSVIPTSIDIAAMDVPTTWFVQGSSGTPAWNLKPTQPGYGANPRLTTNGSSNQLKILNSSLTLSPGTANSIYDTRIAWVPMAIITNRGTGMENIKMSELQYLFTTGRLPTGENLQACTRDPGSGTRNGTMNSIGVDPSWGIGENIAWKNSDPNLGPNFSPSNEGSSGVMEGVVQNTRLAIGYTGMEGGSRAGADAQAGLYEIMGVMKDIVTPVGTAYVRPTVSNFLNNGSVNSGWQIGGPETFVTRGDPEIDSGATAMANLQAAKYIRNITHSISAFETPGGTQDILNNGMPGQLLSNKFTLMAAPDYLPSMTDATNFVVNTGQQSAVKTYSLANNFTYCPAYGSINDAGLVPTRDTGIYQDGSSDGNYIDAHGTHLTTMTSLSKRNQIAGDFNYDFKRDINDIPKMMEAVYASLTRTANTAPNFETAGTPDGYVCIDIIGDFNGDGNFDGKDVRYFADGLALDPVTKQLNRAAGFLAVDTNWTVSIPGHPAGNFFNTVVKKADGTTRPYQAGNSMFDVAGSGTDGYLGSGAAPGADPRGADGVVDAKDVAYVEALLTMANTKFGHRSLDFKVPAEAAVMDLSCDFNGDLKVDDTDKALLQAVVSSAPAPVLQSAVSRKTHTGAGDFDINLPLDGSGIECRINGPTKVIMTFDQPVSAAADFAVLLTSGTVTGTACVGNTLEIDISGATNKAWEVVGVSGLQGSGTSEGTYTLAVGALYGDVNFNKLVNATDAGLVKTKSSTSPVDATNFQFDVNCSGSTNATDAGIVKGQASSIGLP